MLSPGTRALSAGAAAPRAPAIIQPSKASPLEALAAREIRRYVYLRTGRLLPVTESVWPERGEYIVVARRDRVPPDPGLASVQDRLAELAAQQYVLRTIESPRRKLLLVVGGDDLGTLFGAYRLTERLGVRFYLHGDVLPDRQVAWRLPALDEMGKPLFALRGIQPFHDFPEGPDWWNRDDYLAIISQLPKLGMNFIGLHTYPEGKPNAEPTVWIGLPEDIGRGAEVKFSYPASYQNTLRGNWGYATKKTSQFALGAAALFERDDFGAEVMWGACPEPRSPEGCNRVFGRTATLLREAFEHAHRLGVKTCLGTETPLTVPKRVVERLQSLGKGPTNALVLQELYEGIFRRAAQAYPLDYYWFWTPEAWTWEGIEPEQIAATTNDLFAALAAAKKANAPFQLATCGWVLGPHQDRVLFDRVLPKDVAVSCINREVGRTPVDRTFAKVNGRSKWAIPWLEDDPALTSPQLWVGRMRRDAADAYRYGCDGLMGIHWRTRVLGPTVSALARAAWGQGGWTVSPSVPPEPPRLAGPVGGKFADFSTNAIADTEDDPLYQTVRYNVTAYHLPVPDGPCTVTLKFCEPNFKETGKRVFDVKAQGRTVLEQFDIFAAVGQNRAVDYTYDAVVTNGWLDLEFVPIVEYPCIAAIAVRRPGFATNINCGGLAYKDFGGDWPASETPKPTFPATGDFYSDWAWHEFGPEVALRAAAIFERIDGRLPRPSDWVQGPGGIKPDPRPWSEVSEQYAFVAELAELAPSVRGAGSRARFEYWLNTFEYLRAMAQVNCTWAAFTNVMAQVKAETNAPARKRMAFQLALPLRQQLILEVANVYRHLLATVSNPGELGTVANWEQHLLPDLLTKPVRELAQAMGEEPPADAQLEMVYRGPTRLIVPTMRTSFAPGETLRLKAIVLAETPPRQAALHWRALGRGRFVERELRHVARGVYEVEFPGAATKGEDLEYYLEVRPARGKAVRFPPTAPEINQTLVAHAE